MERPLVGGFAAVVTSQSLDFAILQLLANPQLGCLGGSQAKGKLSIQVHVDPLLVPFLRLKRGYYPTHRKQKKPWRKAPRRQIFIVLSI